MISDIGYRIQPVLNQRTHDFKIRDIQTIEQILFDIPHGIFNDPFFIAFAHVAGNDFKPVIIGKIHVPGD
jgi:hypothetical protein